MIITTTSTIEGRQIVEYTKMVQANIVIGANFLRDFMASFTDVFGGTSGVYQRKLNSAYDEVMRVLEYNAKMIRADAIVGVRVDFDEVSGGGKSMFMISATGTAVKLKDSKELNSTNLKDDEHNISLSEYTTYVRSKEIYDKVINFKQYLTDSDLAFINTHPSKDFLAFLLNALNGYNPDTYTEYGVKIVDTIEKISETLSINELEEVFYSNGDKPYSIWFIRKLNLLNPEIIKNLLLSNQELAIKYLKARKDIYSKDDVNKLKEILAYFDALPNLWKTVSSKGLLGSSKEKHECPCGNVFGNDQEYCPKCFKNNKGLNGNEIEIIEELRQMVNTLEEIMK